MAQRVLVQLVDDLDGTELSEGQGETVNFGIDGKTYDIDLSTKNADKLRKALEPYISAGRRSGGGSSRRASSKSDYDAKAVRAWAKENGYDLPDRGRIPANVREAYAAAGH